MGIDTDELRELANESTPYDSFVLARTLRQAASEIDRLRVALAEARAAERAIHYWKEQNERLQRVYEAADVWMRKSKHLESCAFYPLGAGCTCRLDELDRAITEYEEEARSEIAEILDPLLKDPPF